MAAWLFIGAIILLCIFNGLMFVANAHVMNRNKEMIKEIDEALDRITTYLGTKK